MTEHHENLLDEGFLEWFSGCYRLSASTMPEEQRRQVECAWYAGASCAITIRGTDAKEVIIAALLAHVRRIRQSTAKEL